MKKLFTSTLLTVVSVPFLMAAPTAAKKAQNQPEASNQTQSTVAKTKVHKKNAKKAKKNTSSVTSTSESTPASSASTPKN